MADVIAGIGISHVPSLARVVEEDRENGPESAFADFRRTAEWIQGKKPDTVIVIYNDHGSAFGLEGVPTFAIGAAEHYLPADEGTGRRPVPTFPGDPELSWEIIDRVVPAGFDLAVYQRMDVDHGLSEPMITLFGACDAWPTKVIPLAVNVVQQPTPSARRCYELGRAIGQAVADAPQSSTVAVIGTGGMSHQLQGSRAGYINEDFDRRFLTAIVDDPEALTRLDNIEYIDLAGSEGAELVMWLVMRGALDATVRALYTGYHVPVSSTAAGVVAMENARK